MNSPQQAAHGNNQESETKNSPQSDELRSSPFPQPQSYPSQQPRVGNPDNLQLSPPVHSDWSLENPQLYSTTNTDHNLVIPWDVIGEDVSTRTENPETDQSYPPSVYGNQFQGIPRSPGAGADFGVPGSDLAENLFIFNPEIDSNQVISRASSSSGNVTQQTLYSNQLCSNEVDSSRVAPLTGSSSGTVIGKDVHRVTKNPETEQLYPPPPLHGNQLSELPQSQGAGADFGHPDFDLGENLFSFNHEIDSNRVTPLTGSSPKNVIQRFDYDKESFSSNQLCSNEVDKSQAIPSAGSLSCNVAGEDVSETTMNAGLWNPDEHKLFLIGQVICGKTSYKAISEIVKTRTPIQLAGHAKTHYDRHARKRSISRKSSIYDMTEVDKASIDDLVGKQLLSPEHASQYLDSTRFQVAAQDGTQQALPPSDPRN